MSDKPKRRQYSLEQKLRILKEIESGRKQASVAKEYNLSSSTLSMILKSKDKIKHLTDQCNSLCSRKRMRLGNFSEIESALIVWLNDLQDKNVYVNSGPAIQAKAMEFAKHLGITGFEASAGWLFRFRVRNGFRWKQNMEHNVDIKTIPQLSTDEIITLSRPSITESKSEPPILQKYSEKFCISPAEAYIHIEKIKQFLTQHKDVPESVIMSLDELDDFVSLQLYC